MQYILFNAALQWSVCCLLFTLSLNFSCSEPSSIYSYSSYFIDPRINHPANCYAYKSCRLILCSTYRYKSCTSGRKKTARDEVRQCGWAASLRNTQFHVGKLIAEPDFQQNTTYLHPLLIHYLLITTN